VYRAAVVLVLGIVLTSWLPSSIPPTRAGDLLGAARTTDGISANPGAYYQMHVWGDIYAQPTLTFVPNPGQSRSLSPATAITMRMTLLF